MWERKKLAAKAWYNGAHCEGIAAPMLIRSGLNAVVRRYVYYRYPGIFSYKEGLESIEALVNLDIACYGDNDLVLEVFRIADELYMPRTYDAQYLALARRLSCDFWPVDRRLFNLANDRFGKIRLTGDIS